MSTATPTPQQDDALQDAVQRLSDASVEIVDTLRRIARAVEAMATTASG